MSDATTTHLRAFVAGATGFTGRAIAHQDPGETAVQCLLQVRPGSKQQKKLAPDERIVRLDLGDERHLQSALQGCDAVIQLIGTLRSRFNEAGTYEEVDYGTTALLLDAAQRTGVGHFILLSSAGAGMGLGAYLKWKKRTEHLVRNSGVPFTIVRPSYLAGDDTFSERKKLTNVSAFVGGFSDTPLGAPFETYRPINIQLLARIMLKLVHTGPQNRALEGRTLFGYAKQHGLA